MAALISGPNTAGDANALTRKDPLEANDVSGSTPSVRQTILDHTEASPKFPLEYNEHSAKSDGPSKAPEPQENEFFLGGSIFSGM